VYDTCVAQHIVHDCCYIPGKQQNYAHDQQWTKWLQAGIQKLLSLDAGVVTPMPHKVMVVQDSFQSPINRHLTGTSLPPVTNPYAAPPPCIRDTQQGVGGYISRKNGSKCGKLL
jgi:hypothetical protein